MSKTSAFFRRFGSTMLPMVILAIGIGGFVVFGQKRRNPSTVDRQKTLPKVRVAKATAYEKPFELKVDGTAIPYRRIQLAALVPGEIVQKPENVLNGKEIFAGQLLAEIEPKDFALDVEKAEKDLAARKQDLAQHEVQLANARALKTLADAEVAIEETNVERTQRSVDRGALNLSTLDAAKKLLIKAKNAARQVQNNIDLLTVQRKSLEIARDLASTQLARAKLDLSRTKITSPINGVIISSNIEEGNYVNKGALLFTIDDAGRIEVRSQFKYDDLRWIWGTKEVRDAYDKTKLPPLRCRIVYRARGKEFHWWGTLDRYEGSGLDPQTRTIPVRIRVNNPQLLAWNDDPAPPVLVSGMYLRVEIPVRLEEPLVRVPTSAVRPGNFVWTIQDGKIRIRKVTVVRSRTEDGFALLKPEPGDDGVNIGDAVVVSPLTIVNDGMPIEIIPGK